MVPRKEESYRVARALGVSSEVKLVSGFDYWEIGLLPSEGAVTLKFWSFATCPSLCPGDGEGPLESEQLHVGRCSRLSLG